jgi:hypothetical protein
MLYWSIQVAILSFIFIFLIHHLFHFFKSTLTTPKIKDLVNVPLQNYEKMYNVIHNQPTLRNNNDYCKTFDHLNQYTSIDLLPSEETKTPIVSSNPYELSTSSLNDKIETKFIDVNANFNMKDELKQFLKSQMM